MAAVICVKNVICNFNGMLPCCMLNHLEVIWSLRPESTKQGPVMSEFYPRTWADIFLLTIYGSLREIMESGHNFIFKFNFIFYILRQIVNVWHRVHV